jgi:arsenate reductase (thioredoxin)
MGEGFLRSLDESMEVYSAGVAPAERVNPNSIKVMDEIGIDISRHMPKNASEFQDMAFDYVITVCDHARETCPVFTGEVKNRVHIGFEDPYLAKGTDDQILNVYRKVRDEIRRDLGKFYEDNIRSSK